MTVAEVFAGVGLSPFGPVSWDTPLDERAPGVYVVALVKDKDAGCSINVNLTSSIEGNLWLPNEPIIYIGQTTRQTIAKRVGQFYRHKYGDKSPHRGGQAIKLLLEPFTTSPLDLWLFWAATAEPLRTEHKMLSAFEKRVGRQPYANRKTTKSSNEPERPQMLHTFVALVQDKPGVLTRVASLFRRLNINIVSLTVGESERADTSRMTIVCEAPETAAHRIRASLYKLEITINVDEVGRSEGVIRELCLIKVAAGPNQPNGLHSRSQIFELSQVFRARVVDLAPESIMLEMTGSSSKIEGLIQVLRESNYTILEVSRTGRMAMRRGLHTSAVLKALGTPNGSPASTKPASRPKLSKDEIIPNQFPGLEEEEE